MNGIADFARHAIVPLVIAVCFGLARKYLKPSARLSEDQRSSLDARFGSTKWLVGTGMVVVAVAFAWITHYVLVSLNRYLGISDGPGTSFHVWPEVAIWWFFPGFGAITLCWEITLQLWSAFGRAEDALLYQRWSDGRAGFDATRMLRWMALVIAAPIGVLTILALPMHMAVRQHDIRVCRYAWAKCETFEYSKAVRMTLIDGFRNRDGKLTRRAGVVVDFADGRRWSSADMGEFRKTVDPALSAFLAEHTRLPLGQAEAESDIPKIDANTSQVTKPQEECVGPASSPALLAPAKSRRVMGAPVAASPRGGLNSTPPPQHVSGVKFLWFLKGGPYAFFPCQPRSLPPACLARSSDSLVIRLDLQRIFFLG